MFQHYATLCPVVICPYLCTSESWIRSSTFQSEVSRLPRAAPLGLEVPFAPPKPQPLSATPVRLAASAPHRGITSFRGPETGKRKRVARKADGKLTLVANLGVSWHEKLTCLATHFSLPILAYPGPLIVSALQRRRAASLLAGQGAI